MDTRSPEETLRNAGGSSERTRTPTPLPVEYFEDIEPVLDSADFVQGVLVEKSAIVVYGESNSGKTFLALDLALSVAAGRPWHDRRVEQGGVIYCVLEGGHAFRNRVVAWRRHHDMRRQIPFVSVPAQINLLDPKADAPKLAETIKLVAAHVGAPIKLVVIDTLSRALAGGNENASEDMGMLVKSMDYIRAETDAAVLFIHHSGKDAARGARGHSLLRAAIDTEIEVTDTDGQRCASVVKQRDLSKNGVFGFGLELVDLGENRHGEPVSSCVAVPAEAPRDSGSKLTGAAATALRFLADLVTREGTPPPATFDLPQDILAVPETRWREECETRRLSTAEQRDSRTKAFNRAFSTLLQSQRVSARDGLVWPT